MSPRTRSFRKSLNYYLAAGSGARGSTLADVVGLVAVLLNFPMWIAGPTAPEFGLFFFPINSVVWAAIVYPIAYYASRMIRKK